MPTLRERVQAFLRPPDRNLFSQLTYDYRTTGRRALMPEWYFQAPYGQPRKINAVEIRNLAKTPFVHLCVITIIEDFATTPWAIVPKDRDNFNQNHIDELTDFLKAPNQNKETLPDLMRQWGKDVLELDAGVFTKVFDEASYEEAEFTTVHHRYWKSGDKEGQLKKNVKIKIKEMNKKKARRLKRRMTKKEAELLYKQKKSKKEKLKKQFSPLKEREHRKLIELYVRDGSTFLKDGDYTGFVHRYYQYSFKLPRRDPAIFDRDEIVYSMKCPRSYSFYGWSPIQSLEDMVRTLKEQVITYLALAKEKGVPDGILSILDISSIELKRLREYWRKEIKGKRHKFAVIGREAKFTPTIVTSKDMELLSTQQWFVKIVMACFNLNIPILSLRGEAPRAGTWALQQRERHKAIIPLLQLFENEMNSEILSEFGYDDVEFKFQTYDMEEDKIKRQMQIADLGAGLTTINEVRTEERGQDEVPWGYEPFNVNVHAMRTSGLPIQQFKQEEIEKLTTTSTGGAGTPGYAMIPVRMGSGKARRCMSCGNIILSSSDVCPACGSHNIKETGIELDMKKWIGWDFEGTVKWILEFLKDYDFGQITTLNKKQKKKIKKFLIQSITEGWSVNKLEKEIEVITKDENQARMIARSEIIRAANEGALLHYKTKGFKKVEWIAVPSAPGGRTCDRCLERNGKEFLIKDAEGKIPLHPYCRCTWSAVIE